MYRVGFDIGGTNIAAGIVDDSHAIIARKTWPFKKEAYPGELAETVAEMTHALCRAAGLQKTPASLGIAVPGSIDPEAEHLRLDYGPADALFSFSVDLKEGAA